MYVCVFVYVNVYKYLSIYIYMYVHNSISGIYLHIYTAAAGCAAYVVATISRLLK